MKKILILATAALLLSSGSFAHEVAKGKAKKTCKKGGSCCKKNDKTAKM